ncbi:hypothetical protein PG987_005140 [Apiospora arundinis]
MAYDEFHYFGRLAPELRHMIVCTLPTNPSRLFTSTLNTHHVIRTDQTNISYFKWKKALEDDQRCLHVFCSPSTPYSIHDNVDFYHHSYCQPGMNRYISSERRLIPEHTLRLVNKEALSFVGPASYGWQKFMRIGEAQMRGEPPITMSFEHDMLFLIESSPKNSAHMLRVPPQLDFAMFAPNAGCLNQVRHLALRVSDIAQWQPNGTAADLRLRPGLVAMLTSIPKLQTLHLVVDRVFSGGPDLLGSCSELHDFAASLPRDKYGFSDYDAFATATKCEIPFPAPCRPSPSANIYSVQFEDCDQFFQTVLALVRDYASSPATPTAISPTVRLVVDLDSNLNGHEIEGKTTPPGVSRTYERPKDLSDGYDRYFARSSSAEDWYADVSGYEWTDKLDPVVGDEDGYDKDEGDLEYKLGETTDDDSGDDGKDALDEVDDLSWMRSMISRWMSG